MVQQGKQANVVEHYLDVIKRVLDLSDTCLQGIQYMNEQAKQGSHENTVPVLKSVITSVYQMNESLQPILPLLPSNHIHTKTTRLVQVLSSLADAYRDDAGPVEGLQDELGTVTVYREWKEELEACLYPPYLMALGKAGHNNNVNVLH